MSWRFEWRRTWPDVWEPSFQATWTALFDRNPNAHVYHRPDVVRAWAETHGAQQGARPMMGLAVDPEGRRLLLPWVVVPRRGRISRRRVLEPAGQEFFGYQDPLVEGDRSQIDWKSFWECARREARAVSDQALFRLVHPCCAQGPRSAANGEESPVLDLEGLESFDDLLARCSTNHRGDVRRRIRRLEGKGAVVLWVAEDREVEQAVTDLVERCLPAYSDVWRSRPEGSMVDRPGVRELVTRVVADGLPSGWARYVALSVEGEPVAWVVALFHRRDLYWWIPAYDRRWEAFSPGKVLLAKLLEFAVAKRWSRIHFLTGGQDYKKAWQPTPNMLRTVRWHAPSVRGFLMAGYDALARAAAGK